MGSATLKRRPCCNDGTVLRAVSTFEGSILARNTPGSTPLLMAQERELRAKLKELRDHIVKNADNVGERFPNEARKMHYGDIEHRPIYGEASPDEARALIDEGVEVSPLPVLPEDRN